MYKNTISAANILLPREGFEQWSVIACDQFSSDREYWDRVRTAAGTMPSTLNIIIPEAYLDNADKENNAKQIGETMARYLDDGVLTEIQDSLVYVERTLSDGSVRRGLIGAIDLEHYDFSGLENASILASEGTVLDRLPARIRVRREASLELPHVIALIDDKEYTVLEPLSQMSDKLPKLYDFELMEGGGHIRGYRLSGSTADEVLSKLMKLGEKGGPLMIIGDGNHSLAAAKVCWDELKQRLSEQERQTHPARRALLEVNNVYDPAVGFYAIHRVLFGADTAKIVSKLEQALPRGTDYTLRWVSGTERGSIEVAAPCIGDMLAAVQSALDDYVSRTGCQIDYIHGEDEAEALAGGCTGDNNCFALILPAMGKSDFFETVEKRGVFPRKSFSIGHARDKRYYLECRKIHAD